MSSLKHGNPILECYQCREELSIESYFERNADAKKVDEFITNWCKCRFTFPRDGHCICSSWFRVVRTMMQIYLSSVYYNSLQSFNRISKGSFGLSMPGPNNVLS